MTTEVSLPHPSHAVARALAAEIGTLGPADGDRDWSELGVDSFGLLTLRAECESAAGFLIDDEDWATIESPNQLIEYVAREPRVRAEPHEETAVLAERLEIRLPQMAMSGLSERWLMMTLGDAHWRLVAEALDTPSSDICDAAGNRLYASFSRVRFRSNAPLVAFREGETLDLRASLSHFGPSMFFSQATLVGAEGHTIRADLMSTFALRRDSESNLDLIQGEAMSLRRIRAPALDAMPEFGEEYRSLRTRRGAERPMRARVRYTLLPAHDLNGVGLVYFAAFPAIADLCHADALGQPPSRALGESTIERDICYFANADPDVPLEWRLHETSADGLETDAAIRRADGTPMAQVRTRKVRPC